MKHYCLDDERSTRRHEVLSSIPSSDKYGANVSGLE